MLDEYERELYPHPCEGPRDRYGGIVSQSIDRNWTQLRIENLHPAQQMAYTGFCPQQWVPESEEWFPHLCTGWEMSATATYGGRATLGLCWVKP